jgi:hypothetical protein
MAVPAFDVASAHRFFAADCFNRAWDLIEKRDRTSDDDEQMLLLSHASMWHWTQRPDVSSASKSVGYWQLARVHAILGRADESRRWAHLSLAHSGADEPFLVGYAYEALARAEAIANNPLKSQEYIAAARFHAQQLTSATDKESLIRDLNTIG